MSFRARIAIAAAAAVALAVVVASAAAYVAVRDRLRDEIDRSLEARAREVTLGPRLRFELEEPRLGGAGGYVQLVTAAGQAVRGPGADIPLPSMRATDVAAGTRGAYYEDATVAGTHVRLLTTQIVPGIAVQIARPLDEVDRTLQRLAILLGLVSAGGIGLAGAAGLLVARAALRPVRRLTDATEHVARTHDLTRRIETVGGDELGRLAASFNEMMAALQESTAARRQLVADASHELRTPLTSLRTNVEVLERADVGPEDRDRILADVRAQLEEMTTLVADLVELARGDEPALVREPVRLDELVAYAIERARRHAPGTLFAASLSHSVVEGDPARIERAVANLLDNAAKWSPAGGPVEVEVSGGQVIVRDHGPGIDDDDLPHVFDRFYRAPAARGVPGSGLGLAIVRQVAEEHGGSVRAERAPGGGALLSLRFSGASQVSPA